jgi:signal transduction histidine kinase/CheY-like chemotaxis protein
MQIKELPVEQTDHSPISELTLPAEFPENHSFAPPLTSQGSISSPFNERSIVLPERKTRFRIVIADDDEKVIEGLKNSLASHYAKTLELRFWQPEKNIANAPQPEQNPPTIEKSEENQPKDPLVAQIQDWMQAGWRPDAVIIDMNMDEGGKHGVEYLAALRNTEGCFSLPVILATSDEYRDLDDVETTSHAKLKDAREFEPEEILYGKTADALFLGQIGEHLLGWQRIARRRAWIKLLQKVAKKLDGQTLKVETVAEEIVAYAVQELEVESAFVRWRTENDAYQLVAVQQADRSNRTLPAKGSAVFPHEVSILQDILGQGREPVVQNNLTESEAGIFKDSILGFRFLGAGMVLGSASVGFVTLLRTPNANVFEAVLDGRYLSVLTRLLAAVLGRAQLMRDRQTALLTFANQVAQATDEKLVCEELVKTLHQELHDGEDFKAKVSVRLLDFGEGMLKAKARHGLLSTGEDISINAAQSIHALCIRRYNQGKKSPKTEEVAEKAKETTEYVKIEDVTDPKWAAQFRNTCVNGVQVHSELCVPLAIGDYAIGGVNLEHTDTDFYRKHDVGFVQAAAGLAATAIERIKTAKMLVGMADFTHYFPREETDVLNQRLHNLLYEFSGYSVLVDIDIDPDDAWYVRDVVCQFNGTTKEKIRAQLESQYQTKWDQTWVSKSYHQKKWINKWADFTADTNEFLAVELALPVENMPDAIITQQADALLWFRRDDAPPHRVLLLMWGLPPPMNAASIELLGSLARLFSELDNRQQNIKELVQKNIIGEQAAEIGHVMQHFRHRLGNLSGALNTHIERLDTAYTQHNPMRYQQALVDLRRTARAIANSFNKSKGYVKDIEKTTVQLQEIIDNACQSTGLKERLESMSLHLAIPSDIQVHTDVEIAALVLFSLLENALDAMKMQPTPIIRLIAKRSDKQVILQVYDNGAGVSQNFRQKLFKWGKTTKSEGLGSALAFAKTRMKLLGGDLVFPTSQPTIGALFEMYLPMPLEEKMP